MAGVLAVEMFRRLARGEAGIDLIALLSIGAALGITFPFNLMVGIPTYHWLASRLGGML